MTNRLKNMAALAVGAMALTACGGGGSSSTPTPSPTVSTPTPTPTPTPTVDTTAPNVSFRFSNLTVESGTTATSTLTATDDVGVTTGPTVTCTNGGSFSGRTFTAPSVTTETTSVCTATASDAAGNEGTATLTVMIEPTPEAPVSAFFANTSDTIATDPVLGFLDTPTDPSALIGLNQSAGNNAVSTFFATSTDTGVFDDIISTPQSTLGTVGTPPLNIIASDIDGVDDGILDLVFLDTVNDELVGVPLNADNTFGLPVTRSIPNACDYGRGSGTRFVGPGDDTTRDDLLVGTTDGLFYVASGDATGNRGSGLSAPIEIVPSGNFCNLIVNAGVIGRSIYAAYDSSTGVITAMQGENSDVSTYEELYTANISGLIPLNQEPLLFDGILDFLGGTVVSVFENTEIGGSRVIISSVGIIPGDIAINLDIESPTDIVLFTRGLSEDVIIVSPTSETAVYIPDVDGNNPEPELIEIGTGFDSVGFAAGAIAFSSSTQDDIVIRSLQ